MLFLAVPFFKCIQGRRIPGNELPGYDHLVPTGKGSDKSPITLLPPSPEQIELDRCVFLLALPFLSLVFQALALSLQLCELDSQVIFLFIQVFRDPPETTLSFLLVQPVEIPTRLVGLAFAEHFNGLELNRGLRDGRDNLRACQVLVTGAGSASI